MFSVAHAVHDESMHQEGERCMSQWGSGGSEGGLRVGSKVALASRHFEPLKDSETVTREEPEEMGEAEMNGDGEEDTEIETVVAADGQVAGMEEMKTHLWSTFSVAELLEGGGGQGFEELDGMCRIGDDQREGGRGSPPHLAGYKSVDMDTRSRSSGVLPSPCALDSLVLFSETLSKS